MTIRRRGFTLVELLTVIAIISLLVGIIIPSLARAKDLAQRASCQSTLKGLSDAVHMYATKYEMLPTYEDGSKSSACVGKNRNSEEPSSAESNTRAWFLLIRDGLTTREQFLCAADRRVDRDSYQLADLYDFPTSGGEYPLSYSLQRTKLGPGGSGARVTRMEKGSLVIAADHNGLYRWSKTSNSYAEVSRDSSVKLNEDKIKQSNSPNHSNRAGQNVLRLDGSAGWQETPLCGIEKDNIYTQADGSDLGDATLTGAPKQKRGKVYDSLLVP
ncbi:MAG: type II secretion system protein [Phycisphaerae bacterium]